MQKVGTSVVYPTQEYENISDAVRIMHMAFLEYQFSDAIERIRKALAERKKA